MTLGVVAKLSLSNIIGSTPIVELSNYGMLKKLNSRIYGKLEAQNPAGSIKDRVAKAMIEKAENDGLLKKGSVIIEPTSGNTGIALAAIGSSRGYKVIITMPETMNVERQNLLKLYGAKVILTDGSLGMKGAILKAEELVHQISNAFMPQQFDNPANPDVHRKTTGPEIFKALGSNVDVLVAGVGTGGTITGVGEYLKSQNPKVKIIAVEPASSPVLSKGYAGVHRIPGIGAGFIPKILNTNIYDEVIAVKDEDAFIARREVAISEGLSVGISSGAALAAAVEFMNRQKHSSFNVVVILPDTGERYLSMIS